MKRYYIIYKGIVQGVGFRFRILTIADKYNLTGYVKNLSNGDVEVQVQGNGVDEFVKESLKKDHFINIFDYSIKELPLVIDEEGFIVDY